jgi:crotonobetainyl-CoA:carnitine CoA-transferase CaiB-like acyl-CoA transferase
MLEGYRILDLGQVIAGTIPGMILADLGAEVIKVEPPAGDLGRNPNIAGIGDVSGIFLTFNRGTKGIVINLKTEDGKQVFLDLVAVSDAVIANFRPGTMDRLSIGFDVMKQRNPEIVVVDSSGYGNTGPWRNKPAFDLVQQAVSGHMAITGEPGRPPVRHGAPTADISSALYIALACMAGLLRKAKGHGAVHLEVPMFDVQLAMLGYIATMYLNHGDIPEPPGSAHEYMVPYQAFPTATIPIVLAPREDRFYRKMCEVMGVPELGEDRRFLTNDLRSKNRAELLPILENILLQKSGEAWLALFEQAGVPAAPVNTLDRALDNEQVQARELIREFTYPGSGTVKVVGNPIRDLTLPRTPDPNPAPLLGEHTKVILHDILGYSPARIQALLESGAVSSSDREGYLS